MWPVSNSSSSGSTFSSRARLARSRRTFRWPTIDISAAAFQVQSMTTARDVACDPSCLCSIARWAPIALRAIVGYGFLQHGVAKLFRGPNEFATILHALGVPEPHVMAWLTILVELLGGLAVLL